MADRYAILQGKIVAVSGLRCSICRSSLEVIGQDHLETLEEHVSNIQPSLKDRYECRNRECVACQNGVGWNGDGDCYYGIGKKYPFVNGLSSAFGSHARQSEVEIYKHDEDFTLLSLFFFKIRVRFKYRSNLDGDILSRKPYGEVWIRSPWHAWSCNSYILYMSPLRMFLFLRRTFLFNQKQFWETGHSFYAKKIFEDLTVKNDRRWYPHIWAIYCRIRYRRHLNKIVLNLPEKDFREMLSEREGQTLFSLGIVWARYQELEKKNGQ